MKTLRWTLLAALCMAVFTPAFAQYGVVEVIPLKYRTADQVMPVLRPLLDKNGTMTGMQNQLVIRTTPANLADLKKVLASIDAVPRRLMITVRQDADIERDRAGGEVSARISSGNAAVIVPGAKGAAGAASVEVRRGDDTVRARIDSTRSVDSDRNVQTLQVLEGNSAFIRTGSSVPTPQGQVARPIVNGRMVDQVGGGVEYRDVLSGFYALPRLTGDQVTIEISPQRDTLARPEQNLPRGSVNVQSAATIVTGRLGEWIEIGGVANSASNDRSVLLGSTRSMSSDNRRILLKVDEIR